MQVFDPHGQMSLLCMFLNPLTALVFFVNISIDIGILNIKRTLVSYQKDKTNKSASLIEPFLISKKYG